MTSIQPLAGGFSVRHPTWDDLPAALALTIICDNALGDAGDFSLEELRNEWRVIDLERDAWLVFAPDGTLVGCGMLRLWAGVQHVGDTCVHPDYYGRGIGSLLLRVAEERARERLAEAPAGARVTIRQYVTGAAVPAGQLFASLGYARVRTYWRMGIALSAPPAEPAWPAGIGVRTFVRGQDERPTFTASDEAFEDHFGHVPGNFEDWVERWLGGGDFDPGLWFLAVEGETIAGIVLCHATREAEGMVETLGVRRAWRGRGLGKALLLHAFGAFHRRGKRAVRLYVDSQNLTGATRLYERAGMHVERELVDYEKELRPGIELARQSLAS